MVRLGMRRWAWVLLPFVFASACGGNDSSADSKTEATDANTSAAKSVDGVVDPLAISSFTCRKDEAGNWLAKGTVKNTAKEDRDYKVVVFIGEREGPARTVDLPNLKAGAEVPFEVSALAASPDGPCQLQAVIVP